MAAYLARTNALVVFAFVAAKQSMVAALLMLIVSGCSGSVASQISAPDPAQSASKAIELYDRNGDVKLVTAELQQCPALVVGFSRIDKDSDASITAQEIQSRFQELERQSDVKVLDLSVALKGKPLGGATVTFTPEPFMGEGLQSYSGITAANGRCELVGAEEDLYGLPVGYYKVDIVHGAQGINATRGVEVADDVPTGNRLEIAL